MKIARSIGEFIWINCECKARRDRRRSFTRGLSPVHTIDACTVFRTRYITVHPSPFPSRPPFAFASSFVCPTSSAVRYCTVAHEPVHERRESRIPPGVYPSPAPRRHTERWPTLRSVHSLSSPTGGKIFQGALPFPPWNLASLSSSFLWEYPTEEFRRGTTSGAIKKAWNTLFVAPSGKRVKQLVHTVHRVELESRMGYRENLEDIVWKIFSLIYFSQDKSISSIILASHVEFDAAGSKAEPLLLSR